MLISGIVVVAGGALLLWWLRRPKRERHVYEPEHGRYRLDYR